VSMECAKVTKFFTFVELHPDTMKTELVLANLDGLEDSVIPLLLLLQREMLHNYISLKFLQYRFSIGNRQHLSC
jgi:hypothetical protein